MISPKETLWQQLLSRERPPRSLEEEAEAFLREAPELAQYDLESRDEAYKLNRMFVLRTLSPAERGAQVLWVAFWMIPETNFRESNNPDHYTKELYRESGYELKEGREVTLILLPPNSNPQPILHGHLPDIVESKFSAQPGLVVPTEFEGERTQIYLPPLGVHTSRLGERHSIWSRQPYHSRTWMVICDINQRLRHK